MNKDELINFEKWCVDSFYEGKIRSPIHLSGSKDGKLEDFLIKIFKNIKPEDWVFTTYRSHYHALLKGVDPEWLKEWILQNKSIHVMNKKYKIVSSAIVGGTLSQAVGAAMAIKIKGEKKHVWCFCGDMTASLGVFWDCLRYADFNNLPITFIVEDNGLSTDTPTEESWNSRSNFHLSHLKGFKQVKIIKYERKYAHYGPELDGEERKFILT